MNIAEEVANMSDAQLAEICGGDEPRRWSPKEVQNMNAHDAAKRDGYVDIDGVRYIAVQDYDLDTQLVQPREVIKGLLRHIGENPERGGLLETPDRAAKAWAFWTKGYQENPADIFKVFEDGAGAYDDQVGVFNIPFYSHCEHHLAPIIGHASIAYVPDGKIVGLSKLNRIVECFARRLQVQERLTSDIADAIQTHLDPKGVAVFIKARHLCMESRGICQQGHHTITQRFRGCFATDQSDWRREFLAQCR